MRYPIAFFPKISRQRPTSSRAPTSQHSQKLTIVDLAPGERGRVIDFLPGLSVERQSHLCAYGLAPGARLRVTQHIPVTIVEVDNLELALEGGLANRVQVEKYD